jgi:hypothetical protein
MKAMDIVNRRTTGRRIGAVKKGVSIAEVSHCVKSDDPSPKGIIGSKGNAICMKRFNKRMGHNTFPWYQP